MKRIAMMMMMLWLFIPLANSKSQDFEMPFSLGFYGGLNFNMNNPSFNLNSGNEILPLFKYDKSSTDLGLNFGGIVNVPLTNIFVFSGRIGYNCVNGSFDPSTSSVTFGNEVITPGDFAGNVGYLEISPMMQFHNVIPVDRLYLLGGLEFGLPISNNYEFDYVRSIPNNTTNITDLDNEIPEKNIRFALAFGAGYVFNLSESIMLAPEFSYRLPFTQISAANEFDSWDVPQLRFAVNLLFGSKKEKKVEDPTSFLNVGFKGVNSIDQEGKRNPISQIRVEETRYKELFPLVPYLFFEQNSPDPTVEYKRMDGKSEAGEFNIEALSPDAMDISSQVLDVIGSRMAANQNSTITLTGTNDGAGENKNSGLSLQRAEFAKNYLVVNYGIQPNRITIKSTSLPAKPSSQKDPDGISENRRVELVASDDATISPIIIQGDKLAVASPDNIEFIPFTESSDPIESWNFEIYQSDRLLKQINGTGEPNPAIWQIAPNELNPGAIPVEYIFTAKNSKGLEKTASNRIPVDFLSITRKKSEDMPDQTISKFSLILFDFDSDQVSPSDQKIIDEHISPEIKFNSTVHIYGYTDRIGSDEYNLGLAERRAKSVHDLIKKKAPTAKFIIHPVGERKEIFDNNSPIGRHLSRTVQVVVSTPKS